MNTQAPRAQYIDTVQVARLIRASLKESFPGTKFSVRSERYAGGSSINIGWTDGPTERQVEAISARFQGASFDGMTDLKSYHQSILDGEPARFMADFVFVRRRMTREYAQRCGERAAQRFGLDPSRWTLAGSDMMGWHPVGETGDQFTDQAFGRHAASYPQRNAVAQPSRTAARVQFADSRAA